MRKLVFAPSARNEILTIATDIHKENPAAVGMWVLNLQETCKKIAAFPRMGRQRDDILPGTFLFPYKKHLIFYEIRDDSVTILHVVHGARNLPDLFPPEDATAE
ncbi:type II toxin-antitoxin system RelE/ParE family toxin [Azospirillum griseum]|uniref:type II toxin-antitoxin system RelE/ParE family toxin n=1 Tax=Azospirillum griseum TaxID=2496639 RepID=UPI0013156C89|nr:type II toxin-antitoxin system RelE/ParE family toxin [Azospirillum griseum]